MYEDFRTFLKTCAHVTPTPRQLMWYDTGFYAFIHFSANTYTDREWGDGREDPAIFNPYDLDCGEWARAVKASGAQGIVLTAKHHCGFCLWPTATTEQSVKNCPVPRDIVCETADACREYGLKFGFYLSPWDRNCPLYGSDAYNDFYKAQLTELLTGYGDIFMVWFDGACGEGPNGKKQVYDFPGYIDLVRRYQPDACIFYDRGPDVRWCGNESGSARHAEWAVVPQELVPLCENVTPLTPVLPGGLPDIYNTDAELGSLSNMLYSSGAAFCGAEIDMSIRPGWFYHANEQPHSLERLFETYLRSVGGNACFNLNVPPMPSGRLDPKDIARLQELGDQLRAAFGDNLARDAAVSYDARGGRPTVDLTFPEARRIRYVTLREDLREGQRVESFRLWFENPDGVLSRLSQGTTIGNRRIVRVDCLTRRVRVEITAARDVPVLLPVEVY